METAVDMTDTIVSFAAPLLTEIPLEAYDVDTRRAARLELLFAALPTRRT